MKNENKKVEVKIKDTKESVVKEVVVEKKVKEKKPKFKLISYTIKAIIPTGMYANIQPEVTVEAETLELAERAVMPHIEALFAKYREGGPMVVTPVKIAPSTPTAPVALPKTSEEMTEEVHQDQLKRLGVKLPEETPAIVMTVPFTRAKSAIESCTSKEALDLIEGQIQKSVKLIETEKGLLYTEILTKLKTL